MPLLIIIIVAVALGIVFGNFLLGLGFWGWVLIVVVGIFILAFLGLLD